MKLQFRLRTLMIAVTLAAGLCAGWKLFSAKFDSRVIDNALVGKSESAIVAQFGTPDTDVAGYSVLGLGPPPTLPPEPIRTLIYNRIDGGTLRLWIKRAGLGWVCFESCWYGDGVLF